MSADDPRRSRKRNEDLRDVISIQSVDHVGDLDVDLRVVHAIPAPNHRLAILERRPGKAESRGDVIGVRPDYFRVTFQLIAHTKAQNQPRRRPEGILREKAEPL